MAFQPVFYRLSDIVQRVFSDLLRPDAAGRYSSGCQLVEVYPLDIIQFDTYCRHLVDDWCHRLENAVDVSVGVETLSRPILVSFHSPYDQRLVCVHHPSAGQLGWDGVCMVLILVILEMLTYFRRLQLTLHRDELQQRELLHKRYELIKMKVNPHFLFNAFNQLYAILNIAPERGQHYVLSLSRYYRYLMMNVAERTTVPLSEEKQYLGDYIDLMRQRFSDSVRVDVKGESPASAEIVPLSTQILLENVAKHNIINAKHPMTITITFMPEGFRVSNPVCPRVSDSRNGFGLDFLVSEYKLFGKQVKSL